jgi:hypothetical protein
LICQQKDAAVYGPFPLFLSSGREVYEQFAFRKGFNKEQNKYKKKYHTATEIELQAENGFCIFSIKTGRF